jgi:hypothetical protein
MYNTVREQSLVGVSVYLRSHVFLFHREKGRGGVWLISKNESRRSTFEYSHGASAVLVQYLITHTYAKTVRPYTNRHGMNVIRKMIIMYTNTTKPPRTKFTILPYVSPYSHQNKNKG